MNIIIRDITIRRQSDNNLVNISLDYSISNQPDTLVISVETNTLSQQ